MSQVSEGHAGIHGSWCIEGADLRGGKHPVTEHWGVLTEIVDIPRLLLHTGGNTEEEKGRKHGHGPRNQLDPKF